MTPGSGPDLGVPGSRLVALDEAGHEFNERDWPRIVEEIHAHTRGTG